VDLYRRGEASTDEIKATPRFSSRTSIHKRLAIEASRFLLRNAHPVIDVLLSVEAGVIDLIPHKGVANQLKGILHFVQGKGDVVVMDLHDVKRKATN
jgi:hypothetical protein